MYRPGKVFVHRGCCEWAHLEEEVRFVQVQDQQVTTRSPRIVIKCLLTPSMLITMNVHVHDICSRFRTEAIKSFRLYEQHYTTITNKFDDSFQSLLSSVLKNS